MSNEWYGTGQPCPQGNVDGAWPQLPLGAMWDPHYDGDVTQRELWVPPRQPIQQSLGYSHALTALKDQHDWTKVSGYIKGQQFRAGVGYATVLPDFDFETYSEAGLEFDPEELKWVALPGLSAQKKGLKGCGTRNYVEHHSFRVLSLAWDLKDGKGKRWWRPPELEDLFPNSQDPHYTPLDDLFEYIQTFRVGQPVTCLDGLLEAWNSSFEWQVWEYACKDWPKLRLEQMRCCMAKAKVFALPAPLEKTGEVLNLPIQKDKAGKALITKLTMPKSPSKKDFTMRWTPQTAPEDFAKFYDYNRTDIEAESEASVRIPDLSLFETRVWLMDQRVNMRGVGVNRQGMHNCIAIVEQARLREWARLKTITNNHVEQHTEVAKMLRWMGTRGIQFYNLDEETLEEALERTDLPADVMEVLRIRERMAFGSVNKLFALRAMITAADRLIDPYSYAGAHTMLWNSMGVQIANLYSGAFKKPHQAKAALDAIATGSLEYVEWHYGPHGPWVATGGEAMDALEVVASCLRSLFIASPGHRFISADFTAVQAVVTSCLAREWWRIKVFQTHGKIYEAMASEMTGKPLQFYLDYRKEHGKHHPDRQDYGKLPTLSGDFGAGVGGWKKFGAQKVLGSDENIKAAIKVNRAKQPNIVEFWGGQTRNKFNRAPDGSRAAEYQEFYGLEGAALKAVLDPGVCYAHNGVKYQVYDHVMYAAGPSGGVMAYHNPKVKRSQREWASPWELELTYEGWNTNANKGRSNSWEEMKFYGGVACQNVVARESREFQAHVLLALDEPGDYPIVMHTHDEQVADVPYGQGSVAGYMERARGAVDNLPWPVLPNGERWPIKIPDAWECEFYGKWED